MPGELALIIGSFGSSVFFLPKIYSFEKYPIRYIDGTAPAPARCRQGIWSCSWRHLRQTELSFPSGSSPPFSASPF